MRRRSNVSCGTKSPRSRKGPFEPIHSKRSDAYHPLSIHLHYPEMLHLLLLLQATSPAPVVADQPKAVTAATGSPCRFKDRRGRLVEIAPKVCEALRNYFSPLAPGVTPPPHTLLELVVDQSGKVETCSVIESSGVPQLDAKSCSIAIDKARYASTSATGRIQRQTRRLRIDWPSGVAPRPPAPVPIPTMTNPKASAAAKPPVDKGRPIPAGPAPLSFDRQLAAQRGCPR